MPQLWVLYLFALTSASLSFRFAYANEDEYDESVQVGYSGIEDMEEYMEDEYMEEGEEINESVIEAWSKAFRRQKYDDPIQREKRHTWQSTTNCTDTETPYCWACYGTCKKRCHSYYLLGPKYCLSERPCKCKCCIKPPKGCRYAGVKYSHGTQLPGTCMEMICRDGEWCPSNKISRDCSLCYIRDDPHFDTFDDSVYDWHGQCNYSLVQSNQSYDPEYAVYGDLVDCMGGATCLVTVVFKDNNQTVITLAQSDNIFMVNVNGVNHTLEGSDCAQYIPDTTVLWWNVSGCIRLLGTQGLVVNMCYILGHYRELYVWAPPRLNSSLYGLCGHNNGVEGDDLELRNGSIIPWDNYEDQFSFPYPIVPEIFPESWQTNSSCDPWITVTRQFIEANSSTGSPCLASEHMWSVYQAQCENIVNGVVIEGQGLSDSNKRRYTATCAFDICMINQSSVNNVPGPMPNMPEWEQAVETMVKNRIQIEFASRVCPAGFYPVGGECFKIHARSEPWSIARLLCLAEGTYLANPSDPTLFLQFLESLPNDPYWLGGRGNGTDMLWVRSRDIVSEVEPTLFDVTKEYCLSGGPYAIQECVNRHYFICQYNNKYAYN